MVPGFVSELRSKVEHLNVQGGDIRVLITERPVAVDSRRTHFRRPEQALHVLVYEVPGEERQLFASADRLEEDQRHLWWRCYGECVGREYGGLPEDLEREDLAEITRQPLLNYLLALSCERGEVDFSGQASLNAISADLLDAVYGRQWGAGKHPSVEWIEACRTHAQMTRWARNAEPGMSSFPPMNAEWPRTRVTRLSMGEEPFHLELRPGVDGPVVRGSFERILDLSATPRREAVHVVMRPELELVPGGPSPIVP